MTEDGPAAGCGAAGCGAARDGAARDGAARDGAARDGAARHGHAIERRPATDAEARALASALRLRILRICLGQARTNQEIAGILRRDPASVLHHIRTLVRTGFLEPQQERRGSRGAREVPYLATKKSWQLSTPAQGQIMLDTFLEELRLVPAEGVDTTRLGLRLPPAQMAEFRERLFSLLDEYSDAADDPGAPAWSVFIAIHADPNRPGN